MEKNIFVAVAGVIFLALLIVVIVYVVKFYKVKSNGGFDPTKYATILDASQDAPLKNNIPAVYSAGQNKNQATLTLAFNITAYEQTDQHKVVFSMNNGAKDVASQQFMILMDKDYNNAYIMFNQATNVAGKSSVPVDTFCAFELQNIPLYRWTVMHVVYDQSNGNAKIYIDGELVKVCNLFICNKVIQNVFDVSFVTGGYLKTDNLNIEQTAWTNIKYRRIALAPEAKSKSHILSECHDIFEKLKVEEDKRIRDALSKSCPTRKM
jgi:hypothetical protein